MHWNEAWISNDCLHICHRHEKNRDSAMPSIEQALEFLRDSYRGPEVHDKINSLVSTVPHHGSSTGPSPLTAEAVQMIDPLATPMTY
ncbi:MAG: hypothetical protein OSB09_03105 [Planctomycetota bacterium]|nr:hypothetical protein [Planctomycetota bacterium]